MLNFIMFFQCITIALFLQNKNNEGKHWSISILCIKTVKYTVNLFLFVENHSISMCWWLLWVLIPYWTWNAYYSNSSMMTYSLYIYFTFWASLSIPQILMLIYLHTLLMYCRMQWYLTNASDGKQECTSLKTRLKSLNNLLF